MDYKTLSAILGHYSGAFTMDTYVHSMDEHKRHEMDKTDDLFGMRYSISVEEQPYPVLCTLSTDGCTAHVPDFPKITAQTPTLDAALLEVKQQLQKAPTPIQESPYPYQARPNRSIKQILNYQILSGQKTLSSIFFPFPSSAAYNLTPENTTYDCKPSTSGCIIKEPIFRAKGGRNRRIWKS